MARLLRRVESIVPKRAAGFGGKAQNLAVLARGGFPVPAAYAVPGSACELFLRAVLPARDRPSALLGLGEVEDERLHAIAQKVRDAEIPRELREALTDAFVALKTEGARSVAVRSSSVNEDGQNASAAGLHETVLDVRTVDELMVAVKRCWASLFTPRVLTYLSAMGGAPEAAVGVVIQAMVPAEAAGVLFTVNPLTGDDAEMIINASYGLGAPLVDGRISPDTVRIDKATGRVRDRVIGEKQQREVVDERRGIRLEDVPRAEREVFSIDAVTLEELVALGKRVEDHFDGPRDIEWATSAGSIYVLQARPVTAIPKRRRRDSAPRDRHNVVWSNLNVGEALPGVATPLTWSILSAFSSLGFKRAFGSLGCSIPKDAELVGNFRGRIYLNMTECLEILSQVPGIRPKTLIALGGGGGLSQIESSMTPRSSLGFIARLPITTARFARENYRVTDRVAEFERDFAAERERLTGMDPRVLSAGALSKTLTDVEHLLDQSGAIMLTVYGNMLGTLVLLTAALKIAAKDDADAFMRRLLTGLADVDSAAPGIALWHIAEMARAEEPARDAILGSPAASLREESIPVGPTRRAIANFLKAYGHRGTREAEIAEPRWREDPTLLFATLQIHLRERAGTRPIDLERQQREVSDAALRELARRLPAPAHAAVRHLLSLTQRFMRLRERLRGFVTEVLGMFRTVALDASRRIVMTDPAAGEDAAFFLTIDELRTALRVGRFQVAPRVHQRRAQFERDRALPDPPSHFVGHPPEAVPVAPGTRAFTGLAASGGSFEGVARVVDSPADAADFQRDEILVASCADVGWSPLFLVAGAVVTDLGGPLSHASIVLREYGVPAVVNVKSGTKVIATGDRLRVDGDAGTVHILSSAPAVAEPQ